MKLQKLSICIGTSVVVGSLLTACGSTSTSTSSNAGGSDTSNQKATITFWDNNPGPQTTPLYQELIKRFETANPNITVNYVGIPSASAQQKYDTAIATAQTPDVATVYDRWLSDFASKGALLPLDANFNSWSDKNKIQAKDIQAIRSMIPDNKLYLMPETVVMSVVWYNTDLFKKAGLSDPKSWDDFFNDAAKLTDSANNQYGFTLRGGPSSVTQLEQEIWSYSGVTSYFDANGKSTINDPKNVEFVQKLASLYQNKNTASADATNSYQQMVSEFDSGTAAMEMHNQSSYSQNLQTLGQGKFAGAYLFPSPSTNKIVQAPSIGGFGIFKGTKYPDAAWKFVSFLASSDSQAYYDDNYSDIPTNADAKVTIPVLQQGLQVMESPNTVLIQPPTYLPDYAQIQAQLEPDFQAVLFGKMTAKDFMDKWANLITQSKAKYDALVNKKQ